MSGQAPEPQVVLYPQPYEQAIATLLREADSTVRTAFAPTGRNTPCQFNYGKGSDWAFEAGNLARTVGMRLHLVTDVWVLAPCCGCDTAQWIVESD